ncbi:glycosyltransferase family 4 protein [Candidatus Parcubacteria bacterium]|nr:glycosyltransferase family 4 protein [Candidatus Parcubacteria bacterium]
MSDTKSRRVIAFSLSYDPFWGGAEVAIREITSKLPDYQFDLITALLDGNSPRVEEKGNIRIHRVGFAKRNPAPSDLLRLPWYLTKVFYPPLSFFKACRLIMKERPAFLWAVMSYNAIGASLASMLFRVPLLITLQDGDSVEHMFKRARIRPFVWLIRSAFKRARAVQAISRYLAGLSKSLGFKGEPVVVPNGVDLRVLSEVDAKETAALREYLKLPEQGTILVTTSRLVPKNGVEYVIRAMPELPEVIFVIAGDGPLRAELEELARSLGVEERVRFAGALAHKDVAPFLKLGSIFIRPSLSEGLGISFLEAMAAGVPIIATQVGGISDFLFDPEKDAGAEPTGRAVERKDVPSIVRAVHLYEGDREMTERIRKNARAAAEKYDWDLIAARMKEEVFDRLS